MKLVFILLIVYQLKHFLADFPLQNSYMLGKFKDGWDFLPPLALHAGVHAAMTLLIVLVATQTVLLAVSLALLDFVIHFIMDRIKSGKKYLGRFKALSAKDFPAATAVEKKNNTYFWWSLGFDQMVHHFTHYAIIAFIVLH